MSKYLSFLTRYKRKTYFSSCFLLSFILLTSIYCFTSYKEASEFNEFLKDNLVSFIGIFLLSLSFSYLILLQVNIFELEKVKKNLISLNEGLEEKNRSLIDFNEDLKKQNLELIELNLESKKKNEQLVQLTEKFQIESLTDSLTGLPNRRFFMSECEKNIDESIKTSTSFFLIVVDIDHFKKINDTYGHLIGDLALKHVAQILRESLRENDIVARFGGEEFIIGLPKSNLIVVKSIAERIRITILNSKIKADKHTIRLTASAGVSQYLTHEKNIESTIKRADDALYEAKEAGRNRIVVKL